ncbi:phage late control D family protein [Salmonella enterica subsp. houtenae]|nr:phage late control D family protein [Salmonella enterica subsp. houtenae]
MDARLMSLTLTDNRGLKRTSLIWSWTTPTGLIALPRRGAVIQLALGLERPAAFP